MKPADENDPTPTLPPLRRDRREDARMIAGVVTGGALMLITVGLVVVGLNYL